MASRAVIFDADGVLVDSYGAHLRSWRDLAGSRGLEIGDEQFAATFGRTSREIIETLWPGRFDGGEIARLDSAKEARFRELIAADFPAMGGAAELIEALDRSGLALAVGSSGPPENVALILEKLGLRARFAAVVTGADVTRGKPDPQVFQIALRRLDVRPQRCCVIEDAPAGVEAARAARCAAIALLSTGRRAADFDAAGPDLVVGSLRDLSPETIGGLIDRRR